jgi:hypothetical protein
MKTLPRLIQLVLFATLLIQPDAARAVYDPYLGRWLSRDPIGEEGGINLYGYVENGPIMRTDPLGLQMGIPAWMWNARAEIEGGLNKCTTTTMAGKLNAMGDALAQPPVKAAMVAYGVAALIEPLALDEAVAAIKQNLKIDGPQTNKDGATGRICQIRWGNTPLLRLDYHAIPGSGGKPRLHLNIGPGQGKNSIHIPIPFDNWPPFFR